MASCMYRVGDYVYFEGTPTEPYLIRRIEELNKTPNGNVEARVACFYRRRDISSYLVNQVDRLKLDVPWEDDDDISSDTNLSVQSTELSDTEKHQLRHRELFLTRQNETILATNIRGKCLVTLYNETETYLSYLNSEDLFFYQLVYDPNQKSLNADRGEIRVGTKYQVDVPAQPISHDGTQDNQPSREDLIWNPKNNLTEKQIDQYLIVARSIGTFARALDCPTALKHPSLHMSAASASRDATLFFAMDCLHKQQYNLAESTCSLVPNTGPILVKDQMEDWSAAEANAFEEAIEKCGKDFREIQKEYLSWKSLKGIIEYYYMWKTTDRYVAQRRLKAAEQENKLKQVFIPNYNKAHQCLITNRSQNDTKPCESCESTSSAQWYQWNPSQPNTKLCSECWIYYKKFGGLKYPKKAGADRRQERAANASKVISYKCTLSDCEKDCKTKSNLHRHYALAHGVMFRSGSPRTISKPRNTFSLFSTPLSRAVRIFFPIRHLSRCLTASINFNELTQQWLDAKGDIRATQRNLLDAYRKANEKPKVSLNELFPTNNDDQTTKTFDDYLPECERTNQSFDLPIKYPKLLNDSGDFYAQYTHSNLTIMKKRPYESTDNAHDGPSPKRTLITRQNLIKTKSPSTTKIARSRGYTIPFVDPPDGIYLRVSKDIKRLRKEIPSKELRRIARAPWKKLQTNFVSYVDDDIVILD